MSGSAILTSDAKRPLPAGAGLLGKDGDRTWVKLDWQAFAASPVVGLQGWLLAFPDETAFLAGTVGFTPGQIRETMEWRAAKYTQFLSDFGDELGSDAGRLAAWGRDQGEAWERNSVKCFSLHQEMYFTGRFSFGTHEDIDLLIQWRLALAAWEREAASHRACPSEWAPVFAGLDSASVVERLAAAAADLGQPAFQLAPPRDQSLRVAYTAGSPETAARIQRNELVAEPWPPQFLMALTAREIAALQPLGAATVYLDTEDYLRSARMLTPAQRSREIGRRIASGLSPAEYLACIMRVRLTFLAELRGHIELDAASSRSDPGRIARLESIFRDEMAALDSLSRLQWGPPDGPAYGRRAGDLLLRARALAFFADQAGQSGLAEALSRFTKILPHLEPV